MFEKFNKMTNAFILYYYIDISWKEKDYIVPYKTLDLEGKIGSGSMVILTFNFRGIR